MPSIPTGAQLRRPIALAAIAAVAAIAIAAIAPLAGCAGPRPAPGPYRVEAAPAPPIPDAAPPPAAATADAADVDAERDADLDELRRHAAARNPGLAALHHEWRAALERGPQARTLPDPKLTFTEYLEEIQTRTGPQERRFGLSQGIPWPGKLYYRGAVEDAAAVAAWQRLLSAQIAVDHALRTSWAEYYYIDRSLALTRRNLELVTRLESVARKELAAGKENYGGVVRLQLEAGRLEDRVRSIDDALRPARARLNALAGRPPDAPIATPEDLVDGDGGESGDDGGDALPAADRDAALRAHVEANSPELLVIDAEVRRAEIGRKLAGQRWYPDLMIGIDTIDTSRSVMPNQSDSGENPWMLTIGIDLPIWIPSYRAGVREAEERVRAANERRADARNRLLTELEQALFARRDAERRVRLYRDTLVPKGEEALRAAETAYSSGTATYLDLIDGERTLLELGLAEERALADRARAEADLDRLAGRYPPPRKEDRP